MTDTAYQPQTIDLARDLMKGQLRDLVLDHMMHERQSALPWSLWPEQQQQELIDRVNESVSNAIARAVQILAADGKMAIMANIEQIVVKDGIKIVLKASNTETNLMLAGTNVKGAVLITFAEDTPYQGGQERRPEPLQQDLALDEGEGGTTQGPAFDNTASGEGDAPEDESKRRKKK